MTIKARITFTRYGVSQIVTGKEMHLEDLSVGDVTEALVEAEKYLERITGLKVRITTEAV